MFISYLAVDCFGFYDLFIFIWRFHELLLTFDYWKNRFIFVLFFKLLLFFLPFLRADRLDLRTYFAS